MGSTRRSFTQEYKQQAVGFVLDGQPVTTVASNIGVHEMTLRKWVKKEKDSGRAEHKPLDPNERAELERLRVEITQLQMQLAFAKKVSTWVRPERSATEV